MAARLGSAWAWMAAWSTVGLVNQVLLAWLSRPRSEPIDRLLHHVWDAGQITAMALLCAGVAGAWERWGPPRTWVATLAMVPASLLAGLVLVSPDFERVSERVDMPWVRWALTVAVSLGPPAAHRAGAVLRRGWLRALGPAVAAFAAWVNHRILAADYPGMHFALLWIGVAFAGSALTDAELPKALARRGAPRGVRLGVALAASLLAATTLVVWPSSRVLVEIAKTDGTVLMPLLARLHGTEPASPGSVPRRIGARWMLRSRADVPPSGPSGVPDKPLVILLTWDAVRGEVLTDPSLRQRLPNLSALADTGVEFRTVRSPGSSTRNAMSSIFSGRYNAQLAWKKKRGLGRHLLDDDTPRLPDLLHAGGFATAHLNGYSAVREETGTLGSFDEERIIKGSEGQKYALAAPTLDAALELFDRRQRPLFLYMHWMDAHEPYDSVTREGTPRERWFAEVQSLDRELGRLRAELARRDLADHTLLVVTADHGEALGEHGVPHHGTYLYESLVRVPLVFHHPGLRHRVIDDPVSLMDLGPTLLDLLGLTTPGHFAGQSLAPYLHGDAPKLDRPMLGDAGQVRSIILGRYKVIDDRKKKAVEIYDVALDPAEENNLAGTLGDEEEREMLAELRGYFQATSRSNADEAPDD